MINIICNDEKIDRKYNYSICLEPEEMKIYNEILDKLMELYNWGVEQGEKEDD